MANAITRTLGNIPPKARLMLGVTAVVTAVSITAFVNKFGGSDEELIPQLAGQTEVTQAPGGNQIKKTESGEENIIPKDSPIGIQIEEARQETISDAKNQGGGYMDRLDLSNEKLLEDKNDNEERPVIKAFEDIDDRDPALRNNPKQQYNVNVQNQVQVGNLSLINEEEFLRSELERTGGNNIYAGYIAKIGQLEPRVSNGYKQRSSSNSNSVTKTRQSTSNYANKAGNNNDGLVSRYIRDSSRLPKVNEGTLNKYRGIGKGESPSSREDSSQALSAYEEMANPISYQETESVDTINMGEMHYGILQIAINTDEPGPVRAYIPGEGKAGDSVLLGEPVRVGEKASIMFSNMTKDGIDYPIKAIALDTETLRPGIADSVDRHIFERYFKLAIAAAADGYVSALTGSTTTTNSDGSSNKVIERLPDASDQLAVALGSIGQKLIPSFERQFQRPPTVEVNGNRDIIIMFMTSVDVKN